MTIGLGALFLSGGAEASATGRWRTAVATAGVALFAVAAALLVVASPAPEPAMVGLAFTAALFSGYSRSVGAIAIRVIIYLVLCVTLLEPAGAYRNTAGMIFIVGACWNVLIRTLMADPVPSAVNATDVRRPTPQQLWVNWRRGLLTWAGCQFPLRLAAGLAAACVLRNLWPERHFGWIILTTALLTERPLERLPIKIFQRTIGTAAGVALAWIILSNEREPWQAATMVAGLATFASLARTRSYLFYAILSTPVILLVLDFGKPVDPTLLIDRMIATFIGASIVLVGNQLGASVPASASMSAGRRGPTTR